MEDPSGTLSIEQITQPVWSKRFRKNTSSHSNFGFSKAAFWVRVNDPISKQCKQDGVLVIAWPRLDNIDFFRPKHQGWQRISTGDTHVFSSRDVPHHHFAFNISSQAANQSVYYLRIVSDGLIWLPITLWSTEGFINRVTIEMLCYGLFFGMYCGLILYNLIVYLSVRDIAYLYYLGTLALGLLCFLVNTGFSARFLWPLSPAWDNLSMWFFGLLAGCAHLEFARHILILRKLAAKLDLTMRLYALGGLCVAFAILIFDYAIMSRVASLYFVCGLPITLYAIYISSKKGNPLAPYLGLAFLVSVFGYGVPILFYLFAADVPIWVLYISPLAGLTDAMLLSMALGERIKQLQRQKLLAQHALLQMQKQFSQQLIATQDFERQRVASELHDGIGQNLVVINNRLHRYKQSHAEPMLPQQLNFLAEITQQTIHDVRAISHQLHPHQLDRLGLSTAIATIAKETFSNTEISVSCQIDAIDDYLDKDQALHLYRIVQEAVKNVIQHSAANKVDIILHRRNNHMYLNINDNGSGINSLWFQQKDYSQAFGLSSIQERVQILCGTLDLSNSATNGLTLAIDIPCHREES